MTYTHPLAVHPDAAELRRKAGRYLKKAREEARLTQQEVAAKVGLAYYTTVSQVERGTTRVPPDRMRQWAVALGVEPKVFASTLLRHYDPFMWQMLFGSSSGDR